jgi:sugar/nucleoside kinase (ribokinase family)
VSDKTIDAVVAGHIALDMIPSLPHHAGAQMAALLQPGKLTESGPAMITTGGSVANTGIPLHRYGLHVRLLGRTGDDIFGQATATVLRNESPELADGLVVVEGEQSCYTLVFCPAGSDRAFVHYSGPNETFVAADVSDAELAAARLMHFGYPPLMRCMYADEGAELVSLFSRAKSHGCTTTLDMALPDPDAPSGRVDWLTILKRVLPHVDVFLPSLDEILFMLARPETADEISAELLEDVAAQLLGMGAGIVVLKLGDQGLYLRTTTDAARLHGTEASAPAWVGRQIYATCYEVEVAGATGAGDCTIAGFLAGLLHGQSPERAVSSATGSGACNVERPDASSGIPDWQTLQARIAAGWPKKPATIPLPGWHASPDGAVILGPDDAS